MIFKILGPPPGPSVDFRWTDSRKNHKWIPNSLCLDFWIFFVWIFFVWFLHNQSWCLALFSFWFVWRVCRMRLILCQKFLACSSMNKLENSLGQIPSVFWPKTSSSNRALVWLIFGSVILWTSHNWIWTLTHCAINKRKLYSICKSPICVFTHRQSWLK